MKDNKEQLKREFARTRTFNYTDDERLQMLNDIRDSALEWVAELAVTRKSVGSGAALNMYEQAVHHAAALSPKESTNSSIDMSIAGFDDSKCVIPAAKDTVQA